ncbi:hypothetical protein, partial [Cupriavidus basilensis]|uniref:hypothetical protein n=1 Tax=Cupriavidus basilensis TaxID=68895 RepID=UPI0023E8265C
STSTVGFPRLSSTSYPCTRAIWLIRHSFHQKCLASGIRHESFVSNTHATGSASEAGCRIDLLPQWQWIGC